MRVSGLFFVIMMLLSAPVFAEAQGHIAYCDDASSTAALQNCVNRHHTAAQERLNKVYETLSATLDEEAQGTLRELQASWLEYRDAECDWEAGRVETEGLKKIYELSCETLMTENRASLLEATYKNEDEGKQADLAGFPRWMNALTEDHPDVFWRFGERERLDLNCDGTEDVVMLGAGVSRIKVLEGSEAAMEEGESGRTPHALDVVVAITENLPTGRPKSQLFRLPITQSLEGPSLCTDKVSLKQITLDLPEDTTEEDASEGQSEAANDQPVCMHQVQILGKQCKPVTLSWSGKDYILSMESEPSVDNQ